MKLSKDDYFNSVKSSAQGLTTAEAALRLNEKGYNEITGKSKKLLILQAIGHSTNLLVVILLVAALIAAFTGNLINAIIIFTIVMVSIGLDYYQSHRSLVAIKKLQATLALKANVLRDGKWIEVPSRELVTGDVIHLKAGDLIPADGILLSTKDLHVQEAALTGESLPAEKLPYEVNPERSQVYFGSSVHSGKGVALVIAIAKDTEFGHVVSSLSAKAPPTEFEKGMSRFGRFIMTTVLVLVVFVFAVNLLFQRPILDSLLFSIALAVGLTPELLPMITTVTLAAGAVRMAKQHVIVKNLTAIQNLGSIDILCSDKTGTITKGVMDLVKAVDGEGNACAYINELAWINSHFLQDTGFSTVQDTNPLETAILKQKLNLSDKNYTKVEEFPFDFDRRRSSVVVKNENSNLLIITKGAPEYVLPVCDRYLENGKEIDLDNKTKQNCTNTFEQLSRQGYRVLALAYSILDVSKTLNLDTENQLVFAGFLAFMDPPLPEAHHLLKSLKAEGVSVKLITGDNELVARQVCQQVGLSVDTLLKGTDLDTLDDEELGLALNQTDICARISPAQKQRIIKVLKDQGHVVGYMGDGINDAPSLHVADVGISVANAVDVAREAADIILLKKHLGVLLNGILEGRKSFGNVMKYLMMGTSSNFGNMLSMACAVLFLPFLPMLPTQILLNNFLYDTSQIAIPTDHVDEIFTRKPRHWNIDIIKKFMIYIGPLSSLFDFLTFFVMLYVFKASESLFQTGWFVESLATQTLVVFIIRTVGKPWMSKPSMPLVIMVFTMVTLGLLLPYSPLAKYLNFQPLPFHYFIFLTSATVTYLMLVQFIKNKFIWRLIYNP